MARRQQRRSRHRERRLLIPPAATGARTTSPRPGLPGPADGPAGRAHRHHAPLTSRLRPARSGRAPARGPRLKRRDAQHLVMHGRDRGELRSGPPRISADICTRAGTYSATLRCHCGRPVRPHLQRGSRRRADGRVVLDRAGYIERAGQAKKAARHRGYRLTEERRRHGPTQAQLAAAIGVTPGRVSQIERGGVATTDASPATSRHPAAGPAWSPALATTPSPWPPPK
jgi:DNA-binding XRE family transcriptional regulator